MNPAKEPLGFFAKHGAKSNFCSTMVWKAACRALRLLVIPLLVGLVQQSDTCRFIFSLSEFYTVAMHSKGSQHADYTRSYKRVKSSTSTWSYAEGVRSCEVHVEFKEYDDRACEREGRGGHEEGEEEWRYDHARGRRRVKVMQKWKRC